MLNPPEAKRILEAALLAAQEPLSRAELKRLFDGEPASTPSASCSTSWRTTGGRAVELVTLSSGWRFQSEPEIQPYLDGCHPEKPPRYSRAVMETLGDHRVPAAGHRGDIEDVRGVVVSTQIIQALETRGWIDVVGHRETPGRPALYATTTKFLDDLGLRSLEELPPLEEIAKTLQLEVVPSAETPSRSRSPRRRAQQQQPATGTDG